MSDKQSPQHVEIIWGNPILDEGFTTIPNLIIRNYRKVGLTHGEYSLLTILFSFKHDVKDPYPSQETLAKIFYGDSYEEGKSERALRKLIKSMEDKNLLEISFRYIEGKRKSNQYNFKPLIDACLAYIKPNKMKEQVEVKTAKKKKLPEQKVPVESAQKVPVESAQKVPTKKKREKDNIKKKNEKESIYPEQVESLDINPLIKRVLEKQMDRLIAFNLNIFDIELHIKNTETVYPANEYAFVLDNLLTKMSKKPESIGAVMNDWLIRNREMNNKSAQANKVKPLHIVREEPVPEWLGKDDKINDDQSNEAYEALKTKFKDENPDMPDSQLAVWMDEKYKEHGIAEFDYVGLDKALGDAKKAALKAEFDAWKKKEGVMS